SGTCIDFNSQEVDLYIVGTEEGKVLEYSSLHKEKILTIFDAHSLPIYSIKWNPFFKRIFITCSADFSVKIWDHRYKNPLIVYELSAPVCDVQWAPFSSTVFAALTLDGNIHIYDIYLNIAKPLCVQNVILKKKLRITHVCFSPFFPILVVGDEKGSISSFKLSPNLRSLQRDNTLGSISILNKETFEQDKIRNILSQEAELNPELVETNRKNYKFERIYVKKTEVDQDEDEEEKNPKKNK
ncbi:dynein intermediate chain, partial [Brachionus plicatilis]